MKQQQQKIQGMDLQLFLAKKALEQSEKEGFGSVVLYGLHVKDVIVSICIA
ncbi:hypothetical protein K492DRAFT_202478 [Lichtheimia hyalospora FSU 10163]|nr:hypothetical protein K492DRAFT_202478 [Lichtheimia hyalospora FSU 10163]